MPAGGSLAVRFCHVGRCLGGHGWTRCKCKLGHQQHAMPVCEVTHVVFAMKEFAIFRHRDRWYLRDKYPQRVLVRVQFGHIGVRVGGLHAGSGDR